MKKSLFILFVSFLSAVAIAADIQTLSIAFRNSTVEVKIAPRNIIPTFPHFTPGNHEPDSSLVFQAVGDYAFQAELPKFQRGFGSGCIGDIIIYQLSSGVVGRNLDDTIVVAVDVPRGKVLVWAGRIWPPGKAEIKFPSYFVAREFPLILIPLGNFQARSSRFNDRDSMQVIYAWTNSSSKTELPAAFQAIDNAANIVGALAPNYWHKFIVNYNGRIYTLVQIINDQGINTGLEHYNAPFSISTSRCLTTDGIVHTLMHSLIGKGTIPEEYVVKDGKFHAADALGFYEGLTTFWSMRYVKDFPAYFPATIYSAKLSYGCEDLTKISLCGARAEKWYSAGYLFWIYMQGQGLDVGKFTKWLFEKNLIDQPFPAEILWGDVIGWIKLYDRRLGKIAADIYQGEYLTAAFYLLHAWGWSPIPVDQVSCWYDMYIGPYALTPGGVQLPTDNYPSTAAYPKFLVSSTGSKQPLEPKKENPARMFVKAHPDSSFRIEFSDGVVRSVKNKIQFGDGTPYFMHGAIIPGQYKKFWQKLNVYFNLKE